ncbi:protein argonaute-3-like, partial [Teleopsis dalmanni]|uniref:protein argonaute-3-like n=1 Tax=Teleopsis dalmanni TaxID=139649 RepID=UPI0018CF6F42
MEESNQPQNRAQIYTQEEIPTWNGTEVENQGDYIGTEDNLITNCIKVPIVANYIKLNVMPDTEVYEYNIKFTPNIEVNSLKSKYLSDHVEIFGKTKLINGSQLLLPYMKSLNYIRVGKNHFDPTNPKIMSNAKLEIGPEYATAVTECEGGLMLCFNLSLRWLDQVTVLEVVTEIHQMKSSEFEVNARKALLGCVVMTSYSNKTYRIDEINFDTNTLAEFDMDGQKISFVDDYYKSHNVDIKDKKQPLLVTTKTYTRPENTVQECVFCLVPELCRLTGLQDNLRSDSKLMREIATFTRASPNQQLLCLEKFIDNVNKSTEAKLMLSCWGLSLAKTPQPLVGRVLGENKCILDQNVSAVVCLPILENTRQIRRNTFLDQYEKCTDVMGIKVQRPKTVVLDSDRIDNLAIALRKAITKQTQIVVSIFSSHREDRYATIKKLCCTEFPVPSQVIIAKTVQNRVKARSTVQKIALRKFFKEIIRGYCGILIEAIASYKKYNKCFPNNII